MLVLTGNGVLNSPAAGTQTIVNTNTLAIVDGSGSASNYTLTGGTLNMTIIPRSTSVSGTKTYDGTTSTATATFGTASLTSVNGLSSSVSATLSGATLSYDDANFNFGL